jgi:hypothetical protein
MNSSICLLGSVSAIRFGIMNGTLDEGLPSAKRTRPVGDLSLISKVFGSFAVIVSTKDSIFCPIESFAPQRLIEGTMSSDVTGLPSCHISPSRSVIVQVSLSSDSL